MTQSFETQGTIHSMGETKEYGQNGFTKREFVILLSGEGENPRYPNHIALELIKDKCELLDNYNLGDEIKVTFNLTGRLWAGNGQGEKCFTSLQCWRIERVGAEASENFHDQPQSQGNSSETTASPSVPNFASDDYDDIPF